ncbi:hypothetical protein GUJ93_ZPchr0013g36541 [Zizania palustris]|uniref:Uncharacterized protein n=1 Tax=Zizania palustris TaxID=103762 RepID=A0A8J6C242_ZIZPA|nr:hypothetical protein GUJ93_ZPchr0013g36541 [Zizania palustris]
MRSQCLLRLHRRMRTEDANVGIPERHWPSLNEVGPWVVACLPWDTRGKVVDATRSVGWSSGVVEAIVSFFLLAIVVARVVGSAAGSRSPRAIAVVFGGSMASQTRG